MFPEIEVCGRCGDRIAMVWLADDALWNEIAGKTGVWCAVCFDRECAERGIIVCWEPREVVRATE